MLKVTPPQGWVAPADSLSQSQAADISMGEMFEDLDDLFLDPQQAKPAATGQAKQAPNRQSKSAQAKTRQPKAKQRPDNPQTKRKPGSPVQADRPQVKRSQSNHPQSKQSQADSPKKAALPTPQARRTQRSPQTQQRPQSQPANAATAQRKRQSVAAPVPNEQPLLPDDSWTSPATRKRRTLVTGIVGVLGSLLLLGAIAAAVLLNLPDGEAKIANAGNADPAPVLEVPNPNGAPDQIGEPNQLNPDGMFLEEDKFADGQFGKIEDLPADDLDPGAAPDLGRPPVIGNDPARAPAIPLEADPPGAFDNKQSVDLEPQVVDPIPPSTKLQVMREPPSSAQPLDGAPKITRVKPAVPSPFSNKPKTGDKPNLELEPETNGQPTDVGMVESFESDLGELSTLLEESGTSILELKDLAASIRTQQLVGLAKYIVETPDPGKLDLQKQLELPIGGLLYESAPLSRVAVDLTAVTGVPVTIDARSIVAAKQDPNPAITATIQDTAIENGLTNLLLPMGLSHRTDGYGIEIGVFNNSMLDEYKFDLPPIDGMDETSKSAFVSEIQILVEPESWVRKTEPATIVRDGDQLTVNCSKSTQIKIAELLEKLSAAYAFSQSPDDDNLKAKIKSRWSSVKPNLDKTTPLVHSIRKEIGEFFGDLHSTSKVNVLVDWHKVSNEGWTAQTIIPGNVREPSVEKTIAEVARAMNLTYRAVDQNTIMITTFEGAAETVDLEVYPVGQLVPEKVSAKLLRRLVLETLGAQIQSEKVRFIYQPQCQCLVVSAPQQLQRQIESLVTRLVEDLTADVEPKNLSPLAN